MNALDVNPKAKILIVFHSNNEAIITKYQSYMNELNDLKDYIHFEVVENFNHFLIIGDIPLNEEFYLFINGKYIGYNPTKYQFT